MMDENPRQDFLDTIDHLMESEDVISPVDDQVWVIHPNLYRQLFPEAKPADEIMNRAARRALEREQR